jgi:multidrug transporter EmrE-like cation transporter
MEFKAYGLLLVAIVLGVSGQLLLKRAMLRRKNIRLSELPAMLFDSGVMLGFGSYGIGTIFYIKVLSIADLSVAYPTVSLGYVLVILMSKILFREAVSPSRWMAVTLICIGVALVGIGKG